MGKINGNSLLMKEVNTNIVRNALREERAATKQKLSEKTGLSIVTVGSILNQLLENNEIYEDKLIPSNGGRPAHRFCYNKDFSKILTVCTYEFKGADTASFCIRNLFGEIIEKKEEILKNPDIKTFEDITDKFIKKYSDIKAIGFSMPGEENNGKIILHDYEKLNNLKFTEHFEKLYNIPVIFENDVNAAVAGYCKNSGKKSLSSVIYIYFPKKYPPGAGIYLDNRLYKGFNGTAGEIKYIPIGVDWNNMDYSLNENIINSAGKLLTAVSAMFNPQEIIICGDFFTEKILKEIKKICRNSLKEVFVPEISLSKNFIYDFEKGITELTLDLLIPKLSLQDK